MKPRSKRACKLTPGTRFASKKAAEDAEIARKINSGVNGQHGHITYEIKPCTCNGFHLVATASQ